MFNKQPRARLSDRVSIGRFQTKNRFLQAAHGCGFGHRDPSATVEMRRAKAAGGWSVVCTEQTEIHPTSDMSPYVELRAWDERDLPVLGRIADAIHQHGALAAVELSHGGANVPNLGTMESPLSPSGGLVTTTLDVMPEPLQARAMDDRDIRDLRRWHRDAALRCRDAGFDIIYVYASLILGLPNQFISPRFNGRGDAYGGPLRNRLRLLDELMADTKDALGDDCAVAVRLTVDELLDSDDPAHPELCAALELLDGHADLWDIVVCGLGEDAGSARFDSSSLRSDILSVVKGQTRKPVTSVGFITDPDTMGRYVEDGVIDLFAAARPSIADPNLPNKILEGRDDEIRTCIKCNICVACDLGSVPVRCTQNPTFGEEFRRGWLPDIIPEKQSASRVAVIGAGPAGLECAAALGERGYETILYEAAEAPGGRVTRESRLPGLGLWAAVRDNRLQRIERSGRVELRVGQTADMDPLLAQGYDHIVFSTGAEWRRDGLARAGSPAPTIADGAVILTPDDIMDGMRPEGHVLIYDEDHYYMGGLVAETLSEAGASVSLATPAAEASIWTHRTMEQRFIQRKLLRMGVAIRPHLRLLSAQRGGATLSCVFSGAVSELCADAIVLVGARQPRDGLFRALTDAISTTGPAAGGAPRPELWLIGDARSPALIAHAVRSGHKFARELDSGRNDPYRFERDMPIWQ